MTLPSLLRSVSLGALSCEALPIRCGRFPLTR